jgi:hypothetical protein
MLALTRPHASLVPTPLLALALLFVAPLAAGQDTLGAVLDQGAVKISADEFRRDLVQRTIIGTTAAGGALELIYSAGGTIAGNGTAAATSSISKAWVQGTWTIDERERVCSSMEFGTLPGGALPRMTLPRRCQFWFKLGETYYLSESDSDRHERILRRTVATAPTAPAPVTAATLPRVLKGSVHWTTGATADRLVFPWSLSVATVKPDGTLEGVVTLSGHSDCGAREVPIVDGVLQGGGVRFRAPMGPRCELSFALTTGREHALEGSVENTKGRGAGGSPMRAWLDAGP